MRDFLTIFLGLAIGVGSFMAGRNYGEKTFRETADYKELVKTKEELNYVRAELETVKTKFQNIADGSSTRKQEEILAQILQVFLADLGLRISDPNTFTKSSALSVATAAASSVAAPKDMETKKANLSQAAEKPKKEFDYKRLKSYEWILTNSRDREEIRKNLKNVEIKNLDLVLRSSIQPEPKALEPIYGAYRGRIIGLDKKEYGTLAVQIFPELKDSQTYLKGSVKVFKNGEEQSTKNFSTNQLGYQVKESSGFLIDNGSQYYQLYKVNETQQLTGYMYQRLVNGTTNTIGSFVLNRTDQF